MSRAFHTVRRGFTLIELLIVILIIGLMVALLLPALSGVRTRAAVTQATDDIRQLSTAIGQFNSTYQVKHLIDQINMVPGVNGSTGQPNMLTTDPAGFSWLKTTWPRLDITNGIPTQQLTTGNQCLVFFLGGPFYFGLASQTGLAASGTNPMLAGAGVNRNNAFFDFKSNRIRNGEFIDPWDTPYVYFSNLGRKDYGINAATNRWSGSSVQPYLEVGSKFANENSFQIISAGPDGKFGPGGTWTMGTGLVSSWSPGKLAYVEGQPGFDDVSNFRTSQLGVIEK